jgi:E3 ubiquitin-protein ligase RGLG
MWRQQALADQEANQTNTQASRYPLSIILVGVGDGPWDSAEEVRSLSRSLFNARCPQRHLTTAVGCVMVAAQQFDDGLPTRQFDNFQFVNFHKEVSYGGEEFGPAYFAVAALQEVPEQYEAIRKLELL